jgi:hypothetical protein
MILRIAGFLRRLGSTHKSATTVRKESHGQLLRVNTDKVTKLLLAVMALALWMIALNPWLQPTAVAAREETDLTNVESYLRSIRSSASSIQSDVSSMQSDLDGIETGRCRNDKIC